MAEAILFGHRALQPLIDIQEQLREAVGKPKSSPYLEPGTGSVLDFVDAVDAKREFAVVDVETTGTDPKMADLLEVAVVKVKGGKISDRWSTFVKPTQPILGNQMHGITDKDVAKAPSAGRCRQAGASTSSATRSSSATTSASTSASSRGPATAPHSTQGRYLDTLDPRPRGLSRPPELQARHPGRVLRGRPDPEPPRPAGRRGDRQPAASASRADLPGRIATLKARHLRRGPGQPDVEGRGQDEARGGPPQGPRQQGPLEPRLQEDLPDARPRRGHPDGRPRPRRSSARSRSRSASCRAPTAPASSPAARRR